MDFHLVTMDFQCVAPPNLPKRSTDHRHSKDLADVAKVGWVDGNVSDGWMDAILLC